MSSGPRCLNWSETHIIFCHISPDSEFFTTGAAISGQIFVISLLIISCLFFNFLMLYAVYKTSLSSSLKLSTSSILLTNLAVVDVLVGVLILPFWITSTATLGWTLPHKVCELTAFVTTTLMQCSIFFLSGIAVDLYGCIRHPLRYPVLATNFRVGLVVFGIWMVGVAVASLPLYGWGKYRFQPQTIPICNPLYLDSISYTIFLILVGMALPFSLMMFSYIKIVQIARNHIRRIDNAQMQLAQSFHEQLITADSHKSVDSPMKANYRLSHAHERHHAKSKFSRNLKTVRRVFIAVVAFFVCWGPYVILNFWSVNHETAAVPYSADLFTTLMAFANSTVNPVIFILLNKDYRRVVRRLTARVVSRCRGNAVISLNDDSDVVSYVGDKTDVNYNGKCCSTVSRFRNSVCRNVDVVDHSAVPNSENTRDGNSKTNSSEADCKRGERYNRNSTCTQSVDVEQNDKNHWQNGNCFPNVDILENATDINLNFQKSPVRTKKGICRNSSSNSYTTAKSKYSTNNDLNGRQSYNVADQMKNSASRHDVHASFSNTPHHAKTGDTTIYTVSDKVKSGEDKRLDHLEEKSSSTYHQPNPSNQSKEEQSDEHANSPVLDNNRTNVKIFDKSSNVKPFKSYLKKEKGSYLFTKENSVIQKRRRGTPNTVLYVADITDGEYCSISGTNRDVTNTRCMN